MVPFPLPGPPVTKITRKAVRSFQPSSLFLRMNLMNSGKVICPSCLSFAISMMLVASAVLMQVRVVLMSPFSSSISMSPEESASMRLKSKVRSSSLCSYKQGQ
jgi:hypothetical protein